MDNSREMERRSWFTTVFGFGFLASIASFLYPVVRFVFPPDVPDSSANEVSAGKETDLKPNTGAIFKFGSRPGILVHTAAGEWKAFSAVCTHLNCTVQYRPDLQQIWCACHNGTYNLNGEVVSGPPPRGLEQYEVHVRSGEIVVSKKS